MENLIYYEKCQSCIYLLYDKLIKFGWCKLGIEEPEYIKSAQTYVICNYYKRGDSLIERIV